VDRDIETQLAARTRQVEELSDQVTQLHGLISQVVENRMAEQAQVAAEDAELTSISYEEPKQWSTPEEVHRKRQQRELDGLKSDVNELKGSFSELVDLQRKQLEQMKQLGDVAAQVRQQVAEPARMPEAETASPSRVVAPNPFEGPSRGYAPTRSLSPAPRMEGDVSLNDFSQNGVSPSVARGTESRLPVSPEGVVVVSYRERTPLASTANSQKSPRKTGLLSKIKNLGRRHVVEETEPIR
jgi:hypothetical protein